MSARNPLPVTKKTRFFSWAPIFNPGAPIFNHDGALGPYFQIPRINTEFTVSLVSVLFQYLHRSEFAVGPLLPRVCHTGQPSNQWQGLLHNHSKLLQPWTSGTRDTVRYLHEWQLAGKWFKPGLQSSHQVTARERKWGKKIVWKSCLHFTGIMTKDFRLHAKCANNSAIPWNTKAGCVMTKI